MDPIIPQPQNLTTPELPSPHKHFLNKKFIITFVILLLLGSGAYAGIWYWQKQQLCPPGSPCWVMPDDTVYNMDPTANWKTYTSTQYGFEFKYPTLISVKKEGETITLNHSIVYRHPNPCDFKGDAPPLEKLSDFGISLIVSNKNLKDTVQSNESDYVFKNFFENNTLKLSEGFIDKFNAGSLNGFQITSGVEGCGEYTYYFPVSTTKTLVVSRPFISELNPINGNYQTYLNLSGIIPPNQEKEFFIKILSTFKFTK